MERWQARIRAKLTGSGTGLTGGSSPSVSIATVSAGGDTGRAVEMTDPKARSARSYADALGRTTQSIQNFVDGSVSDSDDKTTAFNYNAAGMTSLTALLTGGGVQTTEWVFGVTQAGGNKLDSNDAVGATKWPDPSTGAASSSEQETTTVNATFGQTQTATDRNGNVHTLTYDVLGRVNIDAVTTLGSGVDGSVRRIETDYDGQGNPYLITSYDCGLRRQRRQPTPVRLQRPRPNDDRVAVALPARSTPPPRRRCNTPTPKCRAEPTIHG